MESYSVGRLRRDFRIEFFDWWIVPAMMHSTKRNFARPHACYGFFAGETFRKIRVE